MSSQQRDFCCLSVPNQDLQDIFEDHPAYLALSGSISNKLGDASPDKQKYVPVNIIDEEVMMLISHWEDSVKKDAVRMDASDKPTLASPSGSNIYEPVKRFHSDMAVPRRFFRTFWRSLSKRYVRAMTF